MRLRSLPVAALLSLFVPTLALAVPNPRTLPGGPFRAPDGAGNNLDHPQWGAAPANLLQPMRMAYDDGISSPAGVNRESARAISNVVATQPPVAPHAFASNYLWIWGQFIDHDLDLTENATGCIERMDVTVPAGDRFFDREGTGTVTIGFCRSAFDGASGTDLDHQRVQTNAITSFLDASMVYGSSAERAAELRKNDGTGELRTSVGPRGTELPPLNVNGLPNAIPGPDRHLCGDVRCEENTELFSMQTLWVREHNFWARRIRQARLGLSGDDVYQRARMVVGAEIAAITYNEFLPVLLGPKAIPPYTGYHPNVDPNIDTVFSTAAFRVGHTMLTSKLDRLDQNLQPLPGKPLALARAFFNTAPVFDAGGIDPFLRGAAHQSSNAIDPYIVDDVRNFLISGPQPDRFDLAVLNIQRGRDHGLPSYNDLRVAYGLEPKPSIRAVNEVSRKVRARLTAAYTGVEDIDAWVGGLAEPPVKGGSVGELFRTVIADQLTRSRDGDRFFYENVFPPQWVRYFNRVKLSDVIRRNTKIRGEIQDDVFLVQ